MSSVASPEIRGLERASYWTAIPTPNPQLPSPALQAHYAKAPEPKELIILEGSAHAQFLFGTEHADQVMREIIRFLSAP